MTGPAVLARTVPFNECLIFTGTPGRNYPMVMSRTLDPTRPLMAHRVVWEWANDQDIPQGMTVDHVCFTPRCVRPEHLRLATWDENRRRRKRPRVTS